ncbi:glycosyltransferase family 4 protein [Alkalinema pantanalense CENA528]|uniref:glycosyltransferase family 4 protein n=1 Tax=Alkalinema pantanalense TaxID=1620705 RepID=UPI003D6E80B4
MGLLVNLAFLTTKPTGHTVYAQNLVPQLREFHPKLLISLESLPQWQARPPEDGGKLDYFPVSGRMNPDHGSKGHLRRLIWTQFKLPRLYRKFQGSLLFSPIPEMPLGRRIPTIVTLHDLIPLRFPRKRSPLTLYFRHYIPRVLRQAKHVLCDSAATARDAMEFYNIPASQLTPVPLAYDASNFRFLDLPRKPYFLYLGRHDPYKNLSRVLSAFAQVPNHQDYELWIAGPADPRYTPQLEGQAWDLGVRLQFLNYVPYRELPVLLNNAIGLVFPTLWEGFGLPVLEAMACGTPVITSNLSSLPEVAGDAALLVDPYDVNAIAQAMTELISDEQTWQQLRQRGLARAQQFSWQKTGKLTTEILSQFMA